VFSDDDHYLYGVAVYVVTAQALVTDFVNFRQLRLTEVVGLFLRKTTRFLSIFERLFLKNDC